MGNVRDARPVPCLVQGQYRPRVRLFACLREAAPAKAGPKNLM